MTAREILETVVAMPREDWMNIQCGIADLISSRFSAEETTDIRLALAESEAEFDRGEGLTSQVVRSRLGLS